MPSQEILFCLLPPAVVFACARESFFSSTLLEQALGRAHGSVSRWQLMGVLALVPLSLAAYASGGEVFRIAASVASSLGAVWGGSRIGGRYGAGAAVALIALAWTNLLPLEPVFDACALLTALGVGHLLAAILSRRTVAFFLVAFAAVDVAVVSAGMTRQAMFPAAFGELFPLATRPPVFVGVVAGTFFLGAIDIALGVLVASLIAPLPRRARITVIGIYLCCQSVLVVSSALFAAVVPATLPPLAAYLALELLARRRPAYAPARS